MFEQLQHGKKIPACEITRCTKEGHLIKVSMTTSVLQSEAGNPTAVAITEREIL